MNRTCPARRPTPRQRPLRRRGVCVSAADVVRGAWLLLALLSLLPPPAAAAPPAGGEFTEDDLMIWEVRLGRETLADGMLGLLGDDGHVLLPLGELCERLEFAVETDPRRGRAGGWFIDESRRFALDMRGGTATFAGASDHFTSRQVVALGGEIYVSDALLSRWFPLDITARPDQLLVVVRARETLPVQMRQQREKLHRSLLARPGRREKLPEVKAEYRGFTWPLLDVRAEYRGREGNMDPWLNVQASGDLAGVGLRAHLSHDAGSRLVSSARLAAGRQDADGGLLGPLAATRVEAGDLYVPSAPLVLRGVLGRGVSVTNAPLHRPERFDTTELSGDAPPGWEVELYANGALLDFTTVGDDGRYLFRDVPLAFGRNVLRAVAYGPQGQVREQVRVVNVGAEMIPRHALTYRAAAVQNDRFLITGDRLRAATPRRGRWTRSLALGYGLTRRVSLHAGWTRLPLDDGDRSYWTGAVSGAVGGARLRLLGARADDGGRAASLLAQGELGGRSVTFEQALFDAFTSDANDPSRQRTAQTDLRLAGSFGWGERSVSYALSGRTTAYTRRGIRRQDLVTLRLATAWRSLSLTQRWEYRDNVSTLGDNRQFYWSQLLSRHVGPLFLRGQARARLSPAASFEALGLTTHWRPAGSLQVALRMEHNFLADKTTVGASLNLLQSQYALSLNAHSTSDGDRYLGIALTTSLTKVPETRRLHVQRRRLSGQYGATARVFLDRNGNGVWDSHDDPLPGVAFSGNGAWGDLATDANGLAYLPNLPADRPGTVRVDETSLPDPFMKPLREGVRISGHPGAHATLEFPVTYTGDVEGTVLLLDRGRKRPLGGIRVQLVDQGRRVVDSTLTGYDGYYLFQHLRPGWYEVRIDPDQLAKRDLKPLAPLAVMIAGDGGVAGGRDFLLRRNEQMRAER